ncbi:MAG: DUF6986 family protein [Thermoanaerobaculia bacterium]
MIPRLGVSYSKPLSILSGLDHPSDCSVVASRIFDDAATGQGLLNYFLRAWNCGAITEQEVVEKSDLALEELRTRSFVKILKGRRS